MNRKLRIILRLLRVNFLEPCSDIYHFLNPKNFVEKTALMMFLLLFSLTGYGQLALENFESGIPLTWKQINNGIVVPPTPWTTSTDGYLSNGAAFIDPSAHNIGAGVTEQNFLVAPGFTVPANGEVRFFTKQSSTVDNGNIYEIRLTTANHLDHTSYTTVLATWTEAQLSANPLVYEEKVITIPGSVDAGIPVHIAFVVTNTQVGVTPNADAWYIDNVSVLTAQVCNKVLAGNLIVSGLTPQTANLNWTHPTASQFEIQVFPSTTPATPVGPTGIPTGNSYSPTTLTPGTKYDVYIKSICSQSVSTWAGPFNFTTPIVGSSCNTAIVIPATGAPYTYSANLNTFANSAVTYPNQGTNCLPVGVTGNYFSGAKAFFKYTPTQNGLITITQVTNNGGFNHSTGVFVYEGCSNVGVACLGGLTTATVNVPKKISNLYVEVGKTYIIVVSSTYTPSASVAFKLTVETAPCAPPATFIFKDLLQNSVSFSWDNVQSLSNAWEYKVQAANAGVPTGPGIATTTNLNNLINTGLVKGTSYDLYVRSVCNNVPGAWSPAYRFTTQCDAFPTPFTETFTGVTATNPKPCWTPLDINRDDIKWRFGSGNIAITTNTTKTNNNDMMVLPMINLGTTQKRIRFKYQTPSGTTTSRYSIVVSSTGIGPDNFSTVILPTQIVSTNNQFLEKIVNIPTSITGNVNIAFYVSPGPGETANVFYLDDIIVEDKPICPDPLAITFGTITTTTAAFAWQAGELETQWQVVVQPANSGIPTGNGTIVNANNYLAQNLTHATQYEFYVRAYCSSIHQSNWVGPYSFTTVCGVFNTPFYESFNDNDLNGHKYCWTTNDANEDGAEWNFDETGATIQGNPFFGGTPDYDDWLISPAILVNGNKALKFKYKSELSPFFANPRFGVEVLMSTTNTDPSSFTVVMPLMNFTNIEFLEKTVYITANGPVYIAFRVPPSFSTAEGTSVLRIDDVKIEDAPACPAPSDLMVKNIVKNGAVLSWTQGYLETQWEVKVQPVGTGVPTTTGTLTTNNTTFPTGLLQPNTQYEYYVRSYCNATEQSQWFGPLVFTTLCDSFTTPFTETFNPGSLSEACWRVSNANSDSFAWNLNFTLNPYEGGESASIFTGSNGNNNDWLISPTITVGPNQRLRYYYRVMESDFYEDLDVKLSTNGIELNQFTTTLYSVDYDNVPPLNNTEWREKVINLPIGITGDVNIAWHIPQKPENPWGYRGQLLVIDKVVIEDIPACAPPSNLVVQEFADTNAIFNWDSNGTETQWEVYVQPAELTAPIGDGNAQYLHLASAKPYTINNLTPATKYEYYVRAVCNSTNKSEWVGPIEFNSMCSFENLCQYTITLTTGNSMLVGGGIDLMQNGVKLQTMNFPAGTPSQAPPPVDFTVLLCKGVEFSLYWDAIATAPGQNPGALIQVKNSEGNIIWNGNLGTIAPRSTFYTGISLCGTIACPQPTNLAVNGTSQFSWTAGGTETQWEVYVQPLANGTLPQSGTIVTTNSYTPQNSDFTNLKAGTYEFFVRAICGVGNTSFWSGPYKFVRNDDFSKAIQLPVNSGVVCEQSATNVSFAGATASAEPMSCNGVNNGDVWFEFVAASRVHILELGNFSAKNIYQNGTGQEPKITLTLYKVTGTTLQQIACTYNNVIVAAYSSELEVGATYKVRLTLNNTVPFSTLDICVTTPADLCKLDIPNGGFEKPEAEFGLGNFYSQDVVPGWRNNLLVTDTSLFDTILFQNSLGINGVVPYEGGQTIQVMSPDNSVNLPPDPNDMVNIKGMYQDLDSSEITKFAYSFAHVSGDATLQLYAGPPTGPFVTLTEHIGSLNWSVVNGTYNVPAGQNVTRFIFRSKDLAIGNVLDAVSIVAVTELITQPHTLACDVTETTLVAEGVGEWIADAANPGPVVITTPTSKTTTVTGFVHSGEYIFHWKTRYCDHTVVVTNIAVDDIPAVVTPVIYCTDGVATPLTAPDLTGYTLAWYTQPTGGTAIATPTPETTTAGTTPYYVAYVNADGCEGERAQLDVIIKDITTPVVGFTYDAASYCKTATNPVITLDADFSTNGTFAVAPNGLTIDALTGAVDLATSTAGIYEITYTVDPLLCANGDSATFQMEVVAPVVPVTGFTFASSYCIAGTNPTPILADNFYTGGEFNAETGLEINTVTGEIDLVNSQPGTYQVTYTVTAGNCLDGGSSTVTVIVTPLTAPVISFDYESPACINSGTELVPTLANNFNFGGTFSSATLTVDAETGIIDLNTATAGEHDVIYTFTKDALLCVDGGTFIFKVELKAGITPVTNFSYDSSYCSDATNALPQLAAGFTVGGTFKSTTGLVINPITGQIDVANTKAGSYEITYVIEPDAETCNVGGSFSSTIAIAGSLEAAVSRECRGQNAWLTVIPVNGSYDSNTVNYVWKNNKGAIVGSNSAEFNAAEYYALNNTQELPMVFTVTVSSGSCSNEVSYTLHDIMCEIPRGISPNGDGLNDTFDLSGSGVTSLTIFNRYGKKVFSHGANYTNQWHGQDEGNNELPDGTYFYSIAKTDGSNTTGWVYINR